MNKILIIVFVACLFPVTGSAQTVRITYEPGFGFYGMDNLQRIQIGALRQFPFPVHPVEQFPPYLNQSASIGYYFDKNTLFGINMAYLTTGGRNHSRDYSGEYRLDMLVNAFQAGIESEYIFHQDKKLDFYANFKMGIITSTLNATETLTVYNVDSLTTKERITQLSYFLEPNVGLSYQVTKRISLRAGIGFNLNTSALSNQLIDWTGFRTRIVIAYSL